MTRRRRTRSASEIDEHGWRGARRRRSGCGSSRASAASELVYGRRAVREALRGRREVLELLATERAAREPWERKAKIVPERVLTELAGTRDHQGVVARVEPYRYADAYELASTGEPLLVCLDQVTDPRNLGAVCRCAEGAGATGVILPAHRSARVTPAVCALVRGRGGAPARRGRPESRAVPERGEGAATVGVGRGRGRDAMGEADLSGGWRSCSGRRGRGCGRWCGAPATAWSRSRSRARSSR